MIKQENSSLKCKFCGLSFFQRSKLAQHIITVHKSNKPGVCGHCGESFYHANDLKKHYDIVHGEFKCFNCGLSFSQKTKLMAHVIKRDQDNKCENQEKHTEDVHERPINLHKCDFCEESFFQKIKLYHHYDSVHREFKCYNCGLSFSDKSKLRAHISKRYKDNKCEIQEKNIDHEGQKHQIQDESKSYGSDSNKR